MKNRLIAAITLQLKKRVLVSIEKKILVAYSLRKRSTNVALVCSVLKPLTSSDSASPRSKGAVMVSTNTTKSQRGSILQERVEM